MLAACLQWQQYRSSKECSPSSSLPSLRSTGAFTRSALSSQACPQSRGVDTTFLLYTQKKNQKCQSKSLKKVISTSSEEKKDSFVILMSRCRCNYLKMYTCIYKRGQNIWPENPCLQKINAFLGLFSILCIRFCPVLLHHVLLKVDGLFA